MKNIIVLLTSFLVYAYALPTHEEATDSNDPQNYKNIEILLLESAVDQDGGYSFSFENDDGSKVSQEGQRKISDDEQAVERVRGSYSYNDVNGQPVSLTYTADENGFRPVGAHLPTPPPVPSEILKSLKFLATAKPFVDEQLYDYKPKKKVFRGKQYATLNAVQRSRKNLRSNSLRKSLIDETPREAPLRSNSLRKSLIDETSREAPLKSAANQQDATTSKSVPEVSSEKAMETSSEMIPTTATTTTATTTTKKPEEKPAVETTLDVVNESKEKINEALKESIEKTSKLTQSATKETANATIAAIRGEVDKLKDNVKAQVTKINDKISGTKAEADKLVAMSERQSKDVIEKYTGIVSDAVSAAHQGSIDIAPTEASV